MSVGGIGRRLAVSEWSKAQELTCEIHRLERRVDILCFFILLWEIFVFMDY
jgi:hypothetical protein